MSGLQAATLTLLELAAMVSKKKNLIMLQGLKKPDLYNCDDTLSSGISR